jgi:hypothetical protein
VHLDAASCINGAELIADNATDKSCGAFPRRVIGVDGTKLTADAVDRHAADFDRTRQVETPSRDM